MLAPHHENAAILSVRLMQQTKRPAHLVAQGKRGGCVGLRLAQFMRIANRDAQLAAGLGPSLDAPALKVCGAKVFGEDGATARVIYVVKHCIFP